MGFGLIHELVADGLPVTVMCRMLKVSQSGHYEWRSRRASVRDEDDTHLI